jgi:elongator complex protein 4
MSFRKRNVPLNRPSAPSAQSPPESDPGSDFLSLPGVRPSPLDSTLITSTGTPSLDDLLGGHGGLALGSCLLVEESGTTDYAGVLAKFFAAEGLCQGQVVHVVGVPDAWGGGLPGLAEKQAVGAGQAKEGGPEAEAKAEEKMKIAWRYERLGAVGGERERGACDVLYFKMIMHRNLLISIALRHTSASSSFQ